MRIIIASAISTVAFAAFTSSAKAQCSGPSSGDVKGVDCPYPLAGVIMPYPTMNRCWKEGQPVEPENRHKDHLTDAQAYTRLNWALSCNHVGSQDKTKKVFFHSFDPINSIWIPRTRVAYPSFSHLDLNISIWKPEQNPGYPKVPESCPKPADVYWVKVCENY